MQDKILSILKEIEDFPITDKASLEQFKKNYTSKKGIISALFEELKHLEKSEKASVGKLLNDIKNKAEEKEKQFQEYFSNPVIKNNQDFTLRGITQFRGTRHPIQITLNKIIEIFTEMGFQMAEGPEIEDDWHNFSALNFPENHPARDMQDTFFLENPGFLLRTHTSSVQVRLMEKKELPIRAIMPGRVYRNEEITARSHCFFHQVEGLVIDKNVSYADLKQTLEWFVKKLFGENTKIRLRSSYFPFTEISAEVDVSCFICEGKGCSVCKYSGWVEILGCGMVDPQVLIHCGINPEIYSGYAFGLGIERVTMLLNKIADIRLMDQNDIRFLNQFQHLSS
ncbi:MAG: phenylalanine--tRNA ligase alpha subunit [Bacteroidia bacterium]|nr:MAG: phenylalanine--tRNA ligase alpha subunit [Bacteroidia bacterium]